MAIGVAFAAETELVNRAFLADRGDDVLQHPAIGTVVEHIAGGERGEAVSVGGLHRLGKAPPFARAAPGGEADVAAFAEDVDGGGERGRRRTAAPRHQRGDEAVGMRGDILPMEEALAFLAAPRVSA